MDVIDVWVNCPDEAVAGILADALIAERLVACANVFGPINSCYRWKGSVERGREIPLVLKTRGALFEAVCSKVRQLHPYDTPSIVGMRLEFVDPEFASWIVEETQTAQ